MSLMGLFSKMFGGTKDPSKSQSSSSQGQQSAPKNPAQQTSWQQDPSKKPNQATPYVQEVKPSQQAPVAPPPAKKEEKLIMRAYVMALSNPKDIENRERLLHKFIEKANYYAGWNPHHINGRIGLHSDKVKIHLEVEATQKDLDHMIDWLKQTRDFGGLHVVTDPYIRQQDFSYITHSTPQFKRYDGPWSHLSS
jgi:hypothetical protein